MRFDVSQVIRLDLNVRTNKKKRAERHRRKVEIAMNFDNIALVSLLFDFYGKLLTKRQREVMELYYEENLTLAEIADEFEISRQGVHDALKNAEKALKGYEEKLGLVEKLQQSRQAIEEIDAEIDQLTAECQDSKIAEKLKKIKTIIDKELDQ